MKKTTKALALVLCAMLLVVGSVMGTLAYLTSTKEVKNTFTVGNIEIKLDEAKVDENGKALSSGERTIEKNEYHILPGIDYDKDPTVWVKEGSEEAYIRILVTTNKYDKLVEIFGANFKPETYVTGWNRDIWVSTDIKIDADKVTYEFRYKNAYTATPDDKDNVEEYDELDALFTSFKLPGELVDNDELASLAGLEIKVVAQAIQTAGFDDVDAAWLGYEATENN